MRTLCLIVVASATLMAAAEESSTQNDPWRTRETCIVQANANGDTNGFRCGDDVPDPSPEQRRQHLLKQLGVSEPETASYSETVAPF